MWYYLFLSTLRVVVLLRDVGGVRVRMTVGGKTRSTVSYSYVTTDINVTLMLLTTHHWSRISPLVKGGGGLTRSSRLWYCNVVLVVVIQVGLACGSSVEWYIVVLCHGGVAQWYIVVSVWW